MITAIEMKPVVSSNINALGHDALHKVMRVQFTNGSTYDYQNVGVELFDSIHTAESVGKAFTEVKKNPGAYPYTKVQ